MKPVSLHGNIAGKLHFKSPEEEYILHEFFNFTCTFIDILEGSPSLLTSRITINNIAAVKETEAMSLASYRLDFSRAINIV